MSRGEKMPISNIHLSPSNKNNPFLSWPKAWKN